MIVFLRSAYPLLRNLGARGIIAINAKGVNPAPAGRILLSQCQSRSCQIPIVPEAPATSTFAYSNSRNYSSVYSKSYVNPIYLPIERQRLAEADELKKFAYVPILPTNNDQNASVWHDPVIVKFTNYIMKAGYKELARFLVDKVEFVKFIK